MEGKVQDVSLGANKFSERQPIGTATQSLDGGKDYQEPSLTLLFEPYEFTSKSFYKVRIGEFVAAFLFLYVAFLMVKGVSNSKSKCTTISIQGIVWAFGGMIFSLIYCTLASQVII
ncbi:hypothetical protein QN277_005301 [Acacia crassicarpa]|uniref:Uncharacterized protein n=1 Tax=Acacia crassicarpa TaxID=499986 RepID=A0AAE1JWK9_9FABA|nr:hypothetical protein QN277_005301 [Acacia crassicarpa]